MGPQPSVALGLAHFVAHLFGAVFVMSSTFAMIAAVVFIGGGTQGGAADRITGLIIAVIALPTFMFGKFLMLQHGVSPRKWDGGGDDDGSGGGGGGGSKRPIRPRPGGGSGRRPDVVRRPVAPGPAPRKRVKVPTRA